MPFEYFYDKGKMHYAFYRLPKVLFCDEVFSGLSPEAKLLYSIFIDQIELSVRNGWKDSKGRIYVYYPIWKIKKTFHCSNDKAIKLIRELDTGRGMGLIEVVRQGGGKPNRIYIKNIYARKENANGGG